MNTNQTKTPFNPQLYFGQQVDELTKTIEKLENDIDALKALRTAFEHELTIIESKAQTND